MEVNIEYLEFLSKLKFEDNEREQFESGFMNILEFVGEISEIEIPAELELDKPISLSDLREDEVIESLSREQILSNAPKQKDGCFSTPLVVE